MKLKIIDEKTKEKAEEEFNKIHEQVKFSQSHFTVDNDFLPRYVIFCLLEDERYTP